MTLIIKNQTLEAYWLRPWCVGGECIYHQQCSGCDLWTTAPANSTQGHSAHDHPGQQCPRTPTKLPPGVTVPKDIHNTQLGHTVPEDLHNTINMFVSWHEKGDKTIRLPFSHHNEPGSVQFCFVLYQSIIQVSFTEEPRETSFPYPIREFQSICTQWAGKSQTARRERYRLSPHIKSIITVQH